MQANAVSRRNQEARVTVTVAVTVARAVSMKVRQTRGGAFARGCLHCKITMLTIGANGLLLSHCPKGS
jgi:hypothetical protein